MPSSTVPMPSFLKRTTHATSKAKAKAAAATTTKKAAATTSKAPSSSLPASSAPAASSTAAASAVPAAALAPLAAPVLSSDCSTCGWLIQQMNPCVSSGSSVQKCMCSQMNINAYASCILCAGTQSMGSTPQVALTDLVSGCSTDGYSVSATVTNITSTAKFGSSGNSTSSNGTSTSSSGSESSYSPYSFVAFATTLLAMSIGTFF